MATMIETNELRFAYPAEEGETPVLALDGVDVQIEKGSFVVVLGHNGSGKSTLAKTFNAVLLPSGGKVAMDGAPREVFSQVEALRDMGLTVPDTVDLLDRLRHQGVDVPLDALSVEECADAIAAALQ